MRVNRVITSSLTTLITYNILLDHYRAYKQAFKAEKKKKKITEDGINLFEYIQ